MSLSDDQFKTLASKLNNPNEGGFTANMRGTGGSPRSRYLVGQRDVAEDVHDMPSTGTAIREYAERPLHAATLSQPERYLGGWAEKGRGYLDVPKGFKATPEGHVAARESVLANTQIAYGETNTRGGYKRTLYNPFHSENRGEIQAMDDPDQRAVWAQLPLHDAQWSSKKKGKILYRSRMGDTAHHKLEGDVGYSFS